MILYKRYKYLIYTLLYFTFAIGVLTYVYYDKQSRVQSILNNHLQSFKAEKNTIYNNFKVISKNIALTLQNNPVIINLLSSIDQNNKDTIRQLLYERLSFRYERMKLLGVKQFHFHLPPNGESFLRFHKPSKFEDELSSLRYSIKKAIETQNSVEGFEMGRIMHGFRFVYPLFFKKDLIATVEISMSSDIFKNMLHKSFKKQTGIIIDKNYVQTRIWKDEFEHYKLSINNSDYYISTYEQNKSELLLPKLTQEIKEKKPFAIYDTINDNTKSFLPIYEIETEQVVGYLFSTNSAQAIKKLYSDYIIINSLLGLFFITVFWFLRRDLLYKRGLQKKILFKTKELKEKERAMMQQSRLAQMGELINMIAHQWRQPLAAISSTTNSLYLKTTMDRYEKTFFLDRLDKIARYSQHLSTTVDDFRNFFKSHKERREITLEEITDDCVSIIESSLQSKDIKLVKNYNAYKKISTYPSELRQVVLNLLKNAEDALLDRKVEDAVITIETNIDTKNNFLIRIKDNAGGIDATIFDKIYDPYFTTKDEKNGSGLGLYMSKMIIQDHCKGSLSVKNDTYGAVFTITLFPTKGA